MSGSRMVFRWLSALAALGFMFPGSPGLRVAEAAKKVEPPPVLRLWHGTNGTNVEAYLKVVLGDSVTLKTPDGKIITTTRSAFLPADQAYIAKICPPEAEVPVLSKAPAVAAPPAPPKPAAKYLLEERKDVGSGGAKRFEYAIRVAPQSSSNELVQIAETLVESAKKDKGVAVLIRFYPPDSELDPSQAFARAIWAPGGDWEAAKGVFRPSDTGMNDLVVKLGSGLKPAPAKKN